MSREKLEYLQVKPKIKAEDDEKGTPALKSEVEEAIYDMIKANTYNKNR